MSTRLFRWRAANRLTLQALAARLGVSHATLSNVERGLRPPDMETIHKIYVATSGKVDLLSWYARSGRPLPQMATGVDRRKKKDAKK